MSEESNTKGAMPMNDVLRKMVEDYIHNRMPEYIQTLYDVITIPPPTGEPFAPFR